MFIEKNFGFKRLMRFTGGHIIWFTCWTSAAVGFTEYLHYLKFNGFIVPFLPVSIIGTAVAFYVGFKNNSAYDRLWEARKIWGAIVNSSRSWGTAIISYATNQFTENPISDLELKGMHQRLIYRHIGWLYTLRSQLLIPTNWEHINQNKHVKKATESRIDAWGVGLFSDQTTQIELKNYLPPEELEILINAQNTATQIIHAQAKDLTKIRQLGVIEDFRHMELQKILNDFYTFQGQCERIKKFPLPRQYGSSSLIFTGIFLFLLPFGMVTVFHDLSAWGAWVSIPFTLIIGWVYIMMELVGDYSENPFEGLGNDVPMLALCRTIEIDLKEMLDEKDLPPAIEAIDGVLM